MKTEQKVVVFTADHIEVNSHLAVGWLVVDYMETGSGQGFWLLERVKHAKPAAKKSNKKGVKS